MNGMVEPARNAFQWKELEEEQQVAVNNRMDGYVGICERTRQGCGS